MNEKVAKQLRKICKPNDAVSRRVYRRLKKQYTKLPHHARKDFIELLRQTTFDLDSTKDGGILDKKESKG
jgi:hypothetical protein|tara:strand:+ start:1061 stop:1270 length:210 start_codon:yes stop_codon:yes gene_type:complete